MALASEPIKNYARRLEVRITVGDWRVARKDAGKEADENIPEGVGPAETGRRRGVGDPQGGNSDLEDDQQHVGGNIQMVKEEKNPGARLTVPAMLQEEERGYYRCVTGSLSGEGGWV
ncbi:hypothetical protein NDU88_009996 [Pleurodeles waltl]|uniref:Uncharacterized protein n=1 Tax=Pleurodeles waltl TaxID=8319 RepID=A0AAV7PTM9_PLEWA|nr:hypothetical protein NDU88_009996 [Pleurodeles waltl]